LKKTLEFDPDFRGGRFWLGEAYEANRMYKEAVQELERAVQLSGDEPTYLASLGHAYAVSGRRAAALEVLQRLEQLAKERYISSYGMALIYAGLSDKDRALESLEKAFQRRSTWMVHIKVDPRLDPLRTDPRFTGLVRRVGLMQ